MGGAYTSERHHAAVKRCRLAQRRAFATHNRKLKSRLAKLRCSDREFWTLTKEIGGIARSNASAAPSAEALAEHFADKISNAKGVQESEYIPADPLRAPLSSWRIRFKKVLRTLQQLDANKSANGVHLQRCGESALLSWHLWQQSYSGTQSGRLNTRAPERTAESLRCTSVTQFCNREITAQ